MTSVLRRFLILGGAFFLSGCQFGTYVVGTVTDLLSHRPITNATVRLFSSKAPVSQAGCFAIDGTTREPLEFGVSAPGYKPVVIKAAPGAYRVTVTLVLESGLGESKVAVHEISRERYHEMARNCPVFT